MRTGGEALATADRETSAGDALRAKIIPFAGPRALMVEQQVASGIVLLLRVFFKPKTSSFLVTFRNDLLID